MIYNYLVSAYRYFIRHRFFSFLNITGLAIGFSATLLLALFVWQESSYDDFHKNGDRIVRVTMEYKFDGQKAEAPVTGALVATAFSRDFAEVEKAIRFARSPMVVQYEDRLYEEKKFLFADSTLFDIFSFRLLSGNPATALNGPRKVVLTEDAARKYFGEEDPMGKSLQINTREYEITGIIEDAPHNSQIKYEFIGSFASLSAYSNEVWFNANYYTYLLLHKPELIEQLQAKVFDYMKTKESETRMSGENYLTFKLEPLQDVHLYSKLSGLEPNIDIRYIYIFSIVAFLVLFIACINYMNLATARATDRGVEVGIRKVLGAHKQQLFWQYMNETFISVFIAAILALALTSLALPVFNIMVGKTYSMVLLLNYKAVLVIAGVLILLTLAAGAYPSLILTKFSPSKTLKGSFKTSAAGITLRQVLIIFQFTISAALVICSFIIYEQLSFLRNTSLGYQKEHIIVQNIDNDVVKKIDVLRANLAQFPQIEELTMAYETPTSIEWSDGINARDNTSVMTAANPVERNYLNTLNIELIAGRDFSDEDQLKAFSDSAYYLHQKERSIIINEKAANALGWSAEEAIGQRTEFKGNAVIVGVIKDFHFAPLHEEIGPLVLFVDNMYNNLLIRVKGDNVASALDILAASWKEIAPHIPFDPQFLDQEYNAMYANEQHLGMLSLFFTTMTIVLGCLGLLGLSALLITQKTREISIRKVLGASVPQIITVLSKDFIRLIIIAFLFAAPLSWYIMDKWLQDFNYRIDMPYFIYPLAGVILLALALLTLSTQTVQAALRNPADVLKSE